MPMFHWPVLDQIRQGDLTALDGPAISRRSRELAPRTRFADKVVKW